MQKKLVSHEAIEDITITATFMSEPKRLKLSFVVEGDLENYILPLAQMPKRANELWKESCFELFLAHSEQKEYHELNISPSLAWNLYTLLDYRATPKELKLLQNPTIKTTQTQNSFRVDFELEEFDKSFNSINLTAILLTKEKQRTFWSLKKVEGSPDFHNREYFIAL